MTSRPADLVRWSVAQLLRPLAVPYGIAVLLKNSAYDRQWLHSRQLSSPVLSIGNLSLGGTGKTPLVLWLANRLQQRGWQVDVLSRGYGRESRKVMRVDPLGTPQQFGDEPLLMARRGLSVYVGADRFFAGQLAEKDAEADRDSPRRLHLLDDGFQHRKLARAANILLLQSADLESFLLPAGRLREPLRTLARADICVLRAEDVDRDPGFADRVLQLMCWPGEAPEPARLWAMERKTTIPASAEPNGKALAFCAIGDANGFFSGLEQAGNKPVATIAFRDHHVYTRRDIANLKAAARRCGAQYFLTTEKDGVRLSTPLRLELERDSRLILAGLEISLREETRCMAVLEALLHEPLQFRPHDVR